MKDGFEESGTGKSLPRAIHVATQHSMRGRFTSLLVLIGLLFGIVVMPTMAHAVSGGSHGSEMLAVEEIEETGHSHSQGADKDMPCHAVSHHHCSIALQVDPTAINLNGLTKNALVHPAAITPLFSRSQAPPLNPPLT
jgi:hypothetical protein